MCLCCQDRGQKMLTRVVSRIPSSSSEFSVWRGDASTFFICLCRYIVLPCILNIAIFQLFDPLHRRDAINNRSAHVLPIGTLDNHIWINTLEYTWSIDWPPLPLSFLLPPSTPPDDGRQLCLAKWWLIARASSVNVRDFYIRWKNLYPPKMMKKKKSDYVVCFCCCCVLCLCEWYIDIYICVNVYVCYYFTHSPDAYFIRTSQLCTHSVSSF